MKTRVAVAMVALAGCIIGVRGEAAFEADHDLRGVSDLRIDLPSTPIEIFACDASKPAVCPQRIEYAGRWRSVAGTKSDARDRARAPSLVFESLQGFGELRAVVPLDVRGTVDLEMDTIDVPDDRSLEIFTDRGNVRVVGSQAAVAVDVTVGDVEVLGGETGVGILVEIGDVTVESAGPVDVSIHEGNIDVVQTAGAREAYLHTAQGNVELQLADDTNLDLKVRAPGHIRVETDNIVAISRGRLDRRTGDGVVRVTIDVGRGSVTIRGR